MNTFATHLHELHSSIMQETASGICVGCAVLVLLGAFYSFAAIVATRAALTSYILDWAIAGISLQQPSRVERLRTAWLICAAFLILAGGLSLMLLTEIAAWIFLTSALGQAFYIGILAPCVFDIEDPPEARGRRQTVNAFIIYALVTVGIAGSERLGYLTPREATPVSHYTLIAALLSLHVVYVASRLLKLKAEPMEKGFDDGADTPSEDQGP